MDSVRHMTSDTHSLSFFSRNVEKLGVAWHMRLYDSCSLLMYRNCVGE